jgi:glycosyltransferase involved in cell wall biosynthesis
MSAEGHEIHLILFQKQIDYPLHPDVKIHELGVRRYKIPFLSFVRLFIKLFLKVWQLRPHYAVGFARIGSQMLTATLYPRVVARFDGYPYAFRPIKWVSAVGMFNLPNVRYVVCPAKEIETDSLRYFVRKSKLVTINNPVADVSGQVEDESATVSDSEKPYFIVVGRLTPQKRIDIILEAYARSKARHALDLYILGEGSSTAGLKALAEKLGLSGSVHFKGFVFEPYKVMQNAFALLSASTKEGFPNVLVESLSLGVPVISSDCKTGPKEIVQDGGNGFLFPVNDGERLLYLMDLLYTDPDLYARIKAQTRQSVTRFESHVIEERWHTILEASGTKA